MNEVDNMVIVQDVRRSHVFVAVIHKKNVANKKRFNAVIKECRLAEAMGKSMYALVESGADIGMLNDMPWKKMVQFTNDFEIFGIIKFIDDSIKVGGFYT